MNKSINSNELNVREIMAGPLSASTKVSIYPVADPSLSVSQRATALYPSAEESDVPIVKATEYDGLGFVRVSADGTVKSE